MQVNSVKKKKIIIFGLGGGSRDVLGLINDINRINYQWEIIGFVGKENERIGESIEGHRIINFNDLPSSNDFYAICSVANPDLKKKITETQINIKNYRLATLIHPNNYIRDDFKAQPGSVMFSAVRISYNVTIGESVWIDSNTNIGHNLFIGQYTSIMPMAVVLGSVGNNCQIGAGAIIHQRVKIGDDSLVGMGTIVTKDVPNKSKVINFPRNITMRNK